MKNRYERLRVPGAVLALALLSGLSLFAPAPISRAQQAATEVGEDISALPQRVQAMRNAILEAARSGDVEALRPVLESNELMPQVSFGGATDPIAHWKETSGDGHGREIMAVMVNVLLMPYVKTNAGTADETYVWPYLAEADLEKLTPEQEVDLYRLVTPADAKAMKEFGGYIGYRLGIGKDGTWHFFVVGD